MLTFYFLTKCTWKKDDLGENAREKLESDFATKMSAKNKQLLEALEENKNLADANRDLRDEMEALRNQLKVIFIVIAKSTKSTIEKQKLTRKHTNRQTSKTNGKTMVDKKDPNNYQLLLFA